MARVSRYWLRDGSRVTIRRVRWTDEPALRRMLAGVSQRGLSQRFFGAVDLDRAARKMAMIADRDLGLVAESTSGEVVAHGGWYRLTDTSAEMAFVVRDDWQDRGTASLLLSHLEEAAAQQRIDSLVASLLPDNRAMLAVFERSEHPMRLRYEADSLRVSIATGPAGTAALAA